MSAQVAADLRAAADLIERDGWCQFRYSREDGAHCASGAIAGVATDARRWRSAIEFLSSFVGVDTVTGWNDDDGRTADEAIAALRAAADAAEAEQ